MAARLTRCPFASVNQTVGRAPTAQCPACQPKDGAGFGLTRAGGGRFINEGNGVARRVKMSHEVQSKSEPLFRKVRPFCAKAHHASEGSVDDHPCAHCSRPVAARDRPATWHFT